MTELWEECYDNIIVIESPQIPPTRKQTEHLENQKSTDNFCYKMRWQDITRNPENMSEFKFPIDRTCILASVQGK